MSTSSGGKKGLWITLAVVGALIVTAGITVAVVLVVKHQRAEQQRADNIAEADRAAEEFFDAAADFREDFGGELDEAWSSSDLSALEDLADEGADEIPELAEVSHDGARNSTDYADAQSAADQLADDLSDMTDQVEELVAGVEFTQVLESALDRDQPAELLLSLTDITAPEIRAVAIPEMTAVLEEFSEADVPKGYEDAAELAEEALQFVIDEFTAMADLFDTGQTEYSFNHFPYYDEAIDASGEVTVELDEETSELIEAFIDGSDSDDRSDDKADEETASAATATNPDL